MISTTDTPLIGVTLGDPFGIGPEIVAKSLQNHLIQSLPVKFCIFASKYFFQNSVPNHISSQVQLPQCVFSTIDTTLERKILRELQSGTSEGPHALGGMFSVKALQKASKAAALCHIDALVTGPISKHALHLAGYPFKGHTDFFVQFFKATLNMFFYSRALKMILVTDHTPLGTVPTQLTQKRLKASLELGVCAMQQFGHKKIHLHILGLNPHAGEHGVIGKEEQRSIIPALQSFRNPSFVSVSGPLAPDSFFGNHTFKKDDLVVAMYHDQGLIPFKMLSRHKGVHVTLGLPFIRTSPDHGTAFDIAGHNSATPDSFIESILAAVKMLKFKN